MSQLNASLVVMMGAGLAVAAGCASARPHDINQVQSQIGRLDERVSELERGSAMSGSSDAQSLTLPVVTQPDSNAAARALEDRLWTKPTPYDVQHALKNAGFYRGPIDGKAGPQTRNATRDFQRAHGLKVDGVVGKRTWEKLGPHLEDGTTVAAAPVK